MVERNRTFYRTFFGMTAALAGQNLISFGVNLADNVMLGSFSETALSGAALVNQLQFFLHMVIGGVADGAVVLMAQYWGKRQTAPLRKILGIAFHCALGIGALMTAASILFPYDLLRLLTPDEAVIAQGMQYLSILCATFVLFAVSHVLIASLRSVEIVRIGIATSLASLLINVAFNYLLIFGNLGFPQMGIRGAAVATLIARVAELGIIVCYLKFRDTRIRLRGADLLHPDRTYLRDYFQVSTPVILSSGVWGLNLFVQTAILGRLGAEAIAANSIATVVFEILTVVTNGSAGAACVMVGGAVGRGDIPLVKRYAHTLQLLFLGIGLATGAAIFLSRGPILSLYSISDETRALARQFLLVLSVTVVGTSYQASSFTGIVRGGGNTRFLLINDMIFVWGVVIPSAAIAAFVLHLPPAAVYICLKSDQILKCAVAVVKVNRFDWITPVTRNREKTRECAV